MDDFEIHHFTPDKAPPVDEAAWDALVAEPRNQAPDASTFVEDGYR